MCALIVLTCSLRTGQVFMLVLAAPDPSVGAERNQDETDSV